MGNIVGSWYMPWQPEIAMVEETEYRSEGDQDRKDFEDRHWVAPIKFWLFYIGSECHPSVPKRSLQVGATLRAPRIVRAAGATGDRVSTGKPAYCPLYRLNSGSGAYPRSA